jgi:hypothetical protein
LYTISNLSNASANFNVNYSLKDYFALEISQSITAYRLKQKVLDTKFSGQLLTTSISASVRLAGKLNVSSNMALNRNIISNGIGVNFAIWNAAVIYRALKGNNLEFKIAALDLLRQNRNVVNFGSISSFTSGTRNVLRNYYMITTSYYPRKFGRR